LKKKFILLLVGSAALIWLLSYLVWPAATTHNASAQSEPPSAGSLAAAEIPPVGATPPRSETPPREPVHGQVPSQALQRSPSWSASAIQALNSNDPRHLSSALDTLAACTRQMAPGSTPFDEWLDQLAMIRPGLKSDVAAKAHARTVYEHCKGFYDGSIPKETLRTLQTRYAASENAAERARVARELLGQRSVADIDTSRLRGTGDFGAYRSLSTAASFELALADVPAEIDGLRRALIADFALCGAGAYCGRDSFAFADACLSYGACSGSTSVDALRAEAARRGISAEAIATLEGLGVRMTRWLQGGQVNLKGG
jgi:hypothetical protein